MYNYYYPLETDSEEIKQNKCSRLNKLRLEWIQHKQTNSTLLNEMQRATISKTLGIPSDSTRYFAFLRHHYCLHLDEQNIELPAQCYHVAKL